MNIAEWLHRTAQRLPDAPALLRGDTIVADYGQFARRARGIAAGLRQSYDIQAGARIGVFMANSTQYLEVLYGIWWAGAVAVPINAKLHAREAAWIIDDAEAALVFTSNALLPALRHAISAVRGGADQAAKPAVAVAQAAAAESQAQTQAQAQTPTTRSNSGSTNHRPKTQLLSIDSPGYQDLLCNFDHSDLARPAARMDGDLAWLFYTSGTTGKPKGVMLSNGNLMAMSLCYPTDVDPVTAQDAALYAAPLSHGAGLYNFIHVRMGARHAVPLSGGFDPAEIFDLAPKLRSAPDHQSLSMFAAPTMVRRLLDYAIKNGATGDGIRTIVYAGAPMYLADIIEAVEVLGPRFVQIFGQGESPMTITALARHFIADRSHPRWRQRLASVGTAQSCMEVRVVDHAGQLLPTGESGEVVARGAAVMRGYWRNEQATQETLRDGWLWTGDIGHLDEDGFLTLCDRSKDLIISGGTNISPREIEEVLLLHKDIHEVAVVGRPQPEWGEEVVAFVVLREGAQLDPASLERHCLQYIARFKRPRAYFQRTELPKNNYGKVLKRQLREELGSPPGKSTLPH